VFKVILPTAIPSILQGVILSIGRIVGETAGLIYTAGTGAQIVDGLNSSGRTLSVHMYMLFCEGMHIEKMASTAVVLLIIVFVINSISSILARKLEVKSKG
jgi:phosphate transport system permease protein